MKKVFDGVGTAIVTPFKNDEVDFVSFGRLIIAQIEAGVSAIIVLGTTGEAATINDAEREAIVDFAVEVVAGRAKVIVGIGGNDPAKIIKYGKEAKAAGADAVMVTAPYYNKATQGGVIKYFEVIAREIKHPIIAYNVPGRTGMNIEAETMQKISGIKYIHGIKESSGNIEQIGNVIRLCPDVAVYCGDDALALPCYALGAKGVISVASNAYPAEVMRVYTLFKARRNRAAKKLFLSQLPLYKNLFIEVNPIPVKYLLNKQGLIANELRLPLTPLSDDKRKLFD